MHISTSIAQILRASQLYSFQNRAVPSNLRRFSGMINFYRSFYSSSATTQQITHRKTQQKHTIYMDVKCDDALTKLKQALIVPTSSQTRHYTFHHIGCFRICCRLKSCNKETTKNRWRQFFSWGQKRKIPPRTVNNSPYTPAVRRFRYFIVH